ncbi:MAG: hypothetical protein HY216_12125 [Candidatus Rokubacteria bacterium]|nr:hypothetical protein [Candidatus Rokubacteria bacterium]
MIADIGRRGGFPVIDLVTLFRERAASDGPLFRHDDIHHTRAGARVFADGIAAELRARVPCG